MISKKTFKSTKLMNNSAFRKAIENVGILNL